MDSILLLVPPELARRIEAAASRVEAARLRLAEEKREYLRLKTMALKLAKEV